MELQNLERDVQTLRKLYRLLRFYRNGSQCACSEWYLDESAKIFFENLLDVATEMVFKAYSKVLRTPFSPDMSKYSRRVAQSSCQTPFVLSDFRSAILQRKLIGKMETSPTSKPRGTRAIDTTPRETCVPSTFFGSSMDEKNGEIKKSSKRVTQRKKVLPCQRESKPRSSSSSWTSQEASSHTYDQGDTGSASSSDSEGYSLSSMTSDPPYMGSTSSSESEEYPLSDQVKLKKHRGGFRRLKDKLALVFHHHHHHHHHHRHGDGDHRDQKTKAGRDTSFWKNAGKIFHGKHKDEAYVEQAADEHRKSMVCKVADKNQHVHFHNLVKGILGQVRQSRKSKGDIKRLGDRRRVGKKAVPKLPGWKLLRLQKAKIYRSKPHGKVEFGSKNPMFKTLHKTT